MKVGDKFYSYEEFEKKLKEYESAVLSKFWVRDCLTLKTQARRFPDGPAANADRKLKYSHLRIACVLGGREHTATGTRRASMKQGCQAGMTLRLSKTGNYLELMHLNEVHNHFHSDHLSSVLGVASDELKYDVMVEDFSRLGVNEKLRREFYECVELLKEKYDCSVNVLCDVADDVFCVFFQSIEMKLVFAAYPDVLFIEGSNNNTDTVVTYLLMVEDSEGNGVIVAVAIMLQIDEEVIDWLIKEFSDQNQSVNNIKIVMGDRGCTLANAFSAKYPDIKVQIPLFHSLNHIKEEVNPQILKISVKERDEIKKRWKNVLLSVSQEIYENELFNFKIIAPKSVLYDFQTTWQPIQEQWVLFRTINYRLMINNSNNRVENIRQNFKSVVTKFTNFEEFIKMLFICIDSIKTTQRNIEFPTKAKINYVDFNTPEPATLYKQYLSKYAYDKVEAELKQLNDCNNFQIIEIDRAFAPSTEGTLQVKQNSCHCLFRQHMQLPCKHILKFRSIILLSQFDESLCDKKWSRSYSEMLAEELNKILVNKQRKIEKMNGLADAIAKLCTDVPINVFSKRLNYIKGLRRKWVGKKGEFVV